ncbi:hypothetical protein BH10ACI4_BH10ACI4_29330 [soil metagenome]
MKYSRAEMKPLTRKVLTVTLVALFTFLITFVIRFAQAPPQQPGQDDKLFRLMNLSIPILAALEMALAAALVCTLIFAAQYILQNRNSSTDTTL